MVVIRSNPNIWDLRRVLLIRLSLKCRAKVKSLVYDLAHFRNLLLMFILDWNKKTNNIFELFNESLLYSLFADRMHSDKTEWQKKKLEEVKGIIQKNEELSKWIELIKEQKKKVNNASLCCYVIRRMVKDLISWIRTFEMYKKHPEKFKEKPQLPKPKKLKFLTRFSFTVPFLKDGRRLYLKLRNGERLVKVLLPKDFKYRIKEVKIVYDMGWIEAQIVYEKDINVQYKGEYEAGIDIGLNNLLSVVSNNPLMRSVIVSGKELKSYNRWWNKKKAEVQSEMDNLKNEVESEKDGKKKKELERQWYQLKKYFWNLNKLRDRKLDNWIHQVTRRLADLLYETGHKKVYIGKNAIDKNGISFSKVVNQNYVYIPHRRLVDKLRYKLEELGIEVIEVDERYTSRASPVSDDIVEIQKKRFNDEEIQFSGKRLSRGLYKDFRLNKVFNADLVGAMNILKIGTDGGFTMNIKTLFLKLCNPTRYTTWDFIYKSKPKSLLLTTRIGYSKPVVMTGSLNPKGVGEDVMHGKG